MKLETIGVVGAGVMGICMAQNLAKSDFQVLLLDINDEILEKARARIKQNIRLQSMFSKPAGGRKGSESVLKRITCSTDYEVLKDADFVIENVTEKWPLKKEVYRKMDAI